MSKTIGEKITELMAQKQLSYRDIENVTNIPKSALHRYASGTTESVPLDRVKKLAEALNVTPEYLSGWDEYNDDKPLYGDHAANLDHFSDKPELLNLYKDIYESESLQLLFDSARDLTPEDLESVLIHIQGIRKARGLD